MRRQAEIAESSEVGTGVQRHVRGVRGFRYHICKSKRYGLG